MTMDRVMVVAAWVRQRQQGQMPEYILYLVAALTATGVLILLGGAG
jgi:hypothetical protein